MASNILAHTPPYVQFSRAVSSPNPRTSHYQQTGIFKTPGGAIILSAGLDDNPSSLENKTGSPFSAYARSTDNGITWTEVRNFAGYICVLFSVGTDVYAMTHAGNEWGSLQIRKSTDDGVTFGTATTLKNANSTNNLSIAPPSPLISGGRVYMPLINTPSVAAGFANNARLTIMHAATSANLMSSGSWSESNNVSFSKAGYTYTHQGLFEPTLLIDKNGDAKISCRLVGTASDAWSKDEAVICDATLGSSASVSYTEASNPITFPGGHVSFNIRLDPQSNKYISISTKNSLGAGNGTHWRQRTCLHLVYSDDLINWTRGPDIIRSDQWEDEFRITREGFQYSDWIFDGDDIIGVVRWAEFPFAINYHQSTSMGFYRIKDYYQNILAPAPANSGVSPSSGLSAATAGGKAV